MLSVARTILDDVLAWRGPAFDPVILQFDSSGLRQDEDLTVSLARLMTTSITHALMFSHVVWCMRRCARRSLNRVTTKDNFPLVIRSVQAHLTTVHNDLSRARAPQAAAPVAAADSSVCDPSVDHGR
jgi:hypothetical protein